MSDVTTSATNDRGFFGEANYPGIFGWIFSTDHKRIGLLYFWSVTIFFCVGVLLGLLIRLELFAPGETIMGPQTYNAAFTLHGVIMIFLFIIPGIPAAFGNLIMPIQIGARDVSFPKLNLFSWYLYVSGAALAVDRSSPVAAHPTPVGLSTCPSRPRPVRTFQWQQSRFSSSVSRRSSPDSIL